MMTDEGDLNRFLAQHESRVQHPDGRTLSWLQIGASEGRPLIYCHGFPGSRVEVLFLNCVARKYQLSIIAPDRPGYGQSTPLKGRTFQDWVSDIRMITEKVGWQTFNVLGVSGGGPYACALAAMLSEQTQHLFLACPLAPFTADERLYRDMPLRLRLGLSLWLRFPALMEKFHKLLFRTIICRHPELFVKFITGRLPEVDRAAITRSEIYPLLHHSITEAFHWQGEGIFEDLHLYTQVWPFQFSDVKCPTHIWYGQQDHVLPWSMGTYYKHAIESAELTLIPDAGHFSLPIEYCEQILAPLCS